MIDISVLTIVYVYTRASFYSIQYWEWPIMYLGTFTLLLGFPAMAIGCNFDDITIASLIGLNVGAIVSIFAFILPFYFLIVTLIPLFVYLVMG